MTPHRALIIGATSAIASRVARKLAEQGGYLFLAARNSEHLETVAADARTRGAASVSYRQFDVLEGDDHATLLDEAWTALGSVDLVLIAHGTLPDQLRCQQDLALARRELETNAVSTALLMEAAAARLEPQGRGTLAVISSVAGDRGRQSNYLYGAAKAMVSTYAAGLRNRLFPIGINVLTIKPGFVDTPMTSAFKKGRLWATPEQIAEDILKAVRRHQQILYTPWFWRIIMAVIRTIPESLFVRLRL